MLLPDSCVISEPTIQATPWSWPYSNFLRAFFISLHLSSLPPFLPFLHLLGMANALVFKGRWHIMLAGTFVSYLSESQRLPLLPLTLLYPRPPRHCACCSSLKPFLCFIFSCLFCPLLAPLDLGTKWKQFQDINWHSDSAW